MDYDKHIRNAKERLQEGAIAGLKLADEGVARASRTLSEYRDSVVAAQEIKRVRKDGDGRPDPLSCDYVGGAGFDGTLPEDVVECLEPSSRVQAQQSNRLNRPPSPSSLAIAMIAERTEELPRSRSRSHSHNPKPNPPLFKSTKTSDHVEKLPNTSRPIGPKNQIKTQSAFKSATISQRVDESHAGVRDVSDSGEYTDDGPKRMKSIRAVQAQGERRNRNGRSAERLEIDTSETSHQAHQGPQGKKEKGDGGNGVMVNVPL